MEDKIYPRPDRLLALAEGPRALSEIASLMSSAPFLVNARRGDGHSVLVMPGFGAGDRSTGVLRGFLNSRGYEAQPWELGTNLGPAMPELAVRLGRRLDEVFGESGGRKVSLVGWSLGGVYSRLLAQLYPDKVRQVITLGSPFAGSPRSTNAYRFIKMMSDTPIEQMPSNHLRLLAGEALNNIPSTAIFSKTDGIVPWQIASQPPSDIAENIEVYTSHLGLGINSAVLYAIADRLGNPEDDWRPFQRTGWKRFVYGPARLDSPGRSTSQVSTNKTRQPI